ncbi:MAG TPA: TlpA disulfide reductase family protein [Segetibacter sp.]|jgi:peroxiredoxin
MKFFLLIFLTCSFSIGQSQDLQKVKFSIEGNVKDVKLPVKLVNFSYNVNGEEKEDSFLVKNGKYKFSGELYEPKMGFFTVKYHDDSANKKSTYQRDYFVVYLDKGKITITSTDSFSNRSVKGSAAHDQFISLQQLDKEYNARLTLLYKQLAELRKEKKEEEVKTLMAEVKKLDKQRRDEVYGNFIKNNPSSPMTLFAINSYSGYRIEPDEVEPLFNLISPTVKASWSGKEFAGRLEGAKRTKIGAYATDFTQNDTSGVPVALSSYKGKYVLVDFWASWCGPCRQENPNVVKAFDKYKDKNFSVLGVSLDNTDGKEKWLKAIRKDGLTWTNVSDLKYFNNAAAKLYGINAIPRNLLIDPDGKIVATDLRGETLEKKLEELLVK